MKKDSWKILRICCCIVIGLALSLVSGVSMVAQPSAPDDQETAAQEMSIQDYSPRSTLVVNESRRPRAKYPVIDIHSHQRTPLAPDRWEAIVSEMDDLNLQVLVNLSGGSGLKLKEGIAAVRSSQHSNRMVFFANIDFSGGVHQGFGLKAAKRLEKDVELGAVGLKIFKNLGLRVKSSSGLRLSVDDPELDPIWEACARLGIPVLIHTGEPSEFFEPVDRHNERWLELTLLPRRRVPSEKYPTFDELMAERNRLFSRHPATTFILAHMGWHANDLARLGALLDRNPNVYPETGAILYELGRQPRTSKSFFVKYQDRILFGKDSYRADEFKFYWRTFETADEYFEYYRDYHAFWRLYGMNLPDEVLRKVYFENALRLLPSIPRSDFTE